MIVIFFLKGNFIESKIIPVSPLQRLLTWEIMTFKIRNEHSTLDSPKIKYYTIHILYESNKNLRKKT